MVASLMLIALILFSAVSVQPPDPAIVWQFEAGG